MNTRFSPYLILLGSFLLVMLLLGACSKDEPTAAKPTQAADSGSASVVENTSEPQVIPTTAAPPAQEESGADSGTAEGADIAVSPTETASAELPDPTSEQAASDNPTPTTIPSTIAPPTPEPTKALPSGGDMPVAPPNAPQGPPTATQGPPQPAAGGDYSGPQDQLSAFEVAAQAAGNASYWGQRCRVNTVTYKCDCPSESATSRFDFPTTNDLSWVATVVSGTINMSLGRAGINTWIATLGGQATTQIELIFLENGYQYTTITTFGDGTTVSCPSVWAR